jgi:4'-phosphopantetheinyl transferase
MVLMIENERRLSEPAWSRLAELLPPHFQKQALQYRRWEDRQASLLGKLLLLKGLGMMEEDTSLINDMQWDEYQRPFLPADIDFNISHTPGLVACALVKAGRIGIDIEGMQLVKIPDYREVFTGEEYQLIHAADYPITAFYDLWTRKEAVIKADGRGFFLSPGTFDAITDRIRVSGRDWWIRKIPAPPNYVCHLALSEERTIAQHWLTEEELYRPTRPLICKEGG